MKSPWAAVVDATRLTIPAAPLPPMIGIYQPPTPPDPHGTLGPTGTPGIPTPTVTVETVPVVMTVLPWYKRPIGVLAIAAIIGAGIYHYKKK